MTSWEIHFHIADARRRFAIVLSHLRPWEQHLHITALLLCLFSFVAGRTISHRAIAFNDAELVIQIISRRLHLFGQRASQLFQIKPLHDGLVVGLADNTEHHIVQQITLIHILSEQHILHSSLTTLDISVASRMHLKMMLA